MIKRTRSALVLILLIIFGAVVGSLLADLARGSQYFDWLSFGKQFGISTDNPFSLDFGILSLKFGLMFNITISTIIGIIASIFVYRRI